MSQTDAGQSTNEESLKSIFEQGMKLFHQIENSKEPFNSDSMQMSIKAAIAKFEKATNLVSISGMFSSNESVEELPTETLQYLLLPVLLGILSLKLYNKRRRDTTDVAEIYFKDFLQRCKDYGVTNLEVPHSNSNSQSAVSGPQTESAKIVSMVQTRDAKIKRYKETKELKQKLDLLSKVMSSATVDDDTRREYFTTLLQSYVNQAFEELSSIEQERPLLEYMNKIAGEPVKADRPRAPFRPVVITRDAAQKAVFGAGYPALPTLTVEEFYDQRVREGVFPGSCANIPHTTVQNTEDGGDETESIRKEALEENDDPEELARRRNMDEYKDDHRRGWGNRYNRS